ncbi:DoxX family protein [Hyphobacterium sp. CCMP332]|nr:DoxX family protein [Hyphobacterium sp. CCMP332]
MEYLEIVLKIVVGLSILNVWLLRGKKSSPFRGGDAKSLKEEFAVYGLPSWVMFAVGTIKVALSLLLLISIYYPSLEMIAALGLAFMMLGAVSMHVKVKDSFKQTYPALLFLALSLVIYFI